MRYFDMFIALVFHAFAAGCAAAPRQDDVTRKTTYDIVEQIRCEAQRAVIDVGIYYKTSAIAYEFTFDVTDDNSNSLNSTWQYPFAGGGLFSLGATAGLNLNRNTVRNFKIVDTFDRLKALRCGIGQLKRIFLSQLPAMSEYRKS